MSQPILILGGFLIGTPAYGPMAGWLGERTGQPVEVVPASRLDWLATVGRWGWVRLLDRVAERAEALARHSPTGRITLVGHSSGGVMLRLWLSDEPFCGRRYDGKRLADRLISLGSPHSARRATALRQWVDHQWPGAYYAPQVHYGAVAGRLDLASPVASATARRLAPGSYAAIAGRRPVGGDIPARTGVEGDGLVPVTSALLSGASPVVLDDVAHGGAFGSRWYGTPEVVAQWWPLLAA